MRLIQLISKFWHLSSPPQIWRQRNTTESWIFKARFLENIHSKVVSSLSWLYLNIEINISKEKTFLQIWVIFNCIFPSEKEYPQDDAIAWRVFRQTVDRVRMFFFAKIHLHPMGIHPSKFQLIRINRSKELGNKQNAYWLTYYYFRGLIIFKSLFCTLLHLLATFLVALYNI